MPRPHWNPPNMALAKIDPDLLLEQEWTGTFYPPGREDLAFGARLAYSPTDGVRLTFAIPISKKFGASHRFLHGETASGIPCTVVGSFDPTKAGFSMHNGYSYRTAEKGYPLSYILFGAHVNDDTTFDAFQFDFTGSQEFFAPESLKRGIPFSREILLSASTAAGTVEVFHTGTFDFAPDDLRAVMHDRDEAALSDLQDAYQAIRTKHPGFHPFLKKTLAFSFHLKTTPEAVVIPACRACASVVDLFAILSFSPTRLSKLWAIGRDNEGRGYQLPIFPSMAADKDTVERCLTERSHHHLPLTMGDFNLAVTLPMWMNKADEFSTATSSIQSQGSTVSPHTVLASIVLSATQLEGIGHQVGQVKDRFGYAARTYSSPKLLEEMTSALACSDQQLGEAISDLRNEIAHVGRPKKHLARLTTRQKYKVARALEVAVAGYILEQIGISTESRHKYQDSLIW